eukprot:TRINITY_DN15104_c0_g1_i1.p1 TRINITY_DN15104_c0_g1~~TRINITY_DN15104_c0_g1_i1.p1  ORF type:complete len:1561 (+),score=311.97 TRINITY_DN15104_c0_g1_i1:366-5048(+)
MSTRSSSAMEQATTKQELGHVVLKCLEKILQLPVRVVASADSGTETLKVYAASTAKGAAERPRASTGGAEHLGADFYQQQVPNLVADWLALGPNKWATKGLGKTSGGIDVFGRAQEMLVWLKWRVGAGDVSSSKVSSSATSALLRQLAASVSSAKDWRGACAALQSTLLTMQRAVVVQLTAILATEGVDLFYEHGKEKSQLLQLLRPPDGYSQGSAATARLFLCAMVDADPACAPPPPSPSPSTSGVAPCTAHTLTVEPGQAKAVLSEMLSIASASIKNSNLDDPQQVLASLGLIASITGVPLDPGSAAFPGFAPVLSAQLEKGAQMLKADMDVFSRIDGRRLGSIPVAVFTVAEAHARRVEQGLLVGVVLGSSTIPRSLREVHRVASTMVQAEEGLVSGKPNVPLELGYFTQLPHFPRISHFEIDSKMKGLRNAMRQRYSLTQRLLHEPLRSRIHRPVALNFLESLVQCCASRAIPPPTQQPRKMAEGEMPSVSESFAIGAAACLLGICQQYLVEPWQKREKGWEAPDMKIDREYLKSAKPAFVYAVRPAGLTGQLFGVGAGQEEEEEGQAEGFDALRGSRRAFGQMATLGGGTMTHAVDGALGDPSEVEPWYNSEGEWENAARAGEGEEEEDVELAAAIALSMQEFMEEERKQRQKSAASTGNGAASPAVSSHTIGSGSASVRIPGPPSSTSELPNGQSDVSERSPALGEASSQTQGPKAQDEDLKVEEKEFGFVTRFFFLVQRALHVLLLPAVRLEHDQAVLLQHMVSSGSGEENGKVVGQYAMILLQYCWDCTLTEPTLIQHATRFVMLEAAWMLALIRSASSEPQQQQELKETFSLIPESVVKDMAAWISFVCSHASEELANTSHLEGLAEWAVVLLGRPDLVKSPVVRADLVNVLLDMADPTRRERSGQATSSGSWSAQNAAATVAHAVLDNGFVHQNLCPLLMRLYIEVDAVEGLDVDRDHFDKMQVRYHLAQLFTLLWRASRATGTAVEMQCESGGDFFEAFASAILGHIKYLLEDALARLKNIVLLEAAKADKAAWERKPLSKRAEEERVLAGEKQTGSGFMAMANQSMAMLELLSESSKVAAVFARAPIAETAANTLADFFKAISGPAAREVGSLERPESYHFRPYRLLTQLIRISTRFSEQDVTFTQAFGQADDFKHALCQQVLKEVFMSQSGVCLPSALETAEGSRFTKFIDAAAEHRTSYEDNIQADVLNQPIATAVFGEGAGGSGRGLADGMVIEEENLPKPVDNAMYEKVMRPLAFGEMRRASGEGKRRHPFASQLEDAASVLDRRGQRRIAREVREITSDNRLPIHANASIFLRQDSERVDLLRALITGQADTPYARGCFVFDIFLPAQYPNVPPLFLLATVGSGNVRFNPNLYADGKVCLSLLGTWHGSEDEKWNPDLSTIWQVLLSIQSSILNEEPVYNEPNLRSMQGTDEGNEMSRKYNSEIRIQTVRHAMLRQLKNPPEGFAEVVVEHFRLQRGSILRQCLQWLDEAVAAEQKEKAAVQGAATEEGDSEATEQRQRLQAAVAELRVHLAEKFRDDYDDEQ